MDRTRPDAPVVERPLLGVSVSVWRGGEVLLVRRGREPGRSLRQRAEHTFSWERGA